MIHAVPLARDLHVDVRKTSLSCSVVSFLHNRETDTERVTSGALDIKQLLVLPFFPCIPNKNNKSEPRTSSVLSST